METTQNQKSLKGGEFIIKESQAQDIFTPEEFNEEQKMMAETTHQFVDLEVTPVLDRLDNHEEGLMESLMKKAGELGLFGISIPEEYGGFDKDFNTSLPICNSILIKAC